MGEHLVDKNKCGGKERLIQATITLIEERPFESITIEEIIKAAELSRPAFYYHFTGGKEELRAELVRRGQLDDVPTQDIHRSILEAALRIFARSGVSAATLDDIASEAGVTRGALCWHYHSKDDLLAAIVKHYSPHSVIRPIIDQIEQDLQSGVALDDETIFRRLAEGFYDGIESKGDFARLAILLIYTHPQAAEVLADMIIEGRQHITEYVRKRQEDGYFRKDIHPALLVQVIAMTFTMRIVGRGLTDVLPLLQLSKEEAINQLVNLLLYGIVQRDQLPSNGIQHVS